MTEVVVLVAFALLVLGVVGSVVPGLPGAPLSLLGVYLYWWNSGYAEPELLVLAGLTIIGLFAIAVDVLAGFVSARSVGVPTHVAVLAAIAGVAGFALAGLPGFMVGVMGTVFVATLAAGGDVFEGGRAAFATMLGIFASGIVGVILTGSMLVVMLVVVL